MCHSSETQSEACERRTKRKWFAQRPSAPPSNGLHRWNVCKYAVVNRVPTDACCIAFLTTKIDRDTEGWFLRFEVHRSKILISRLPLHIIVILVQLSYKWYATLASQGRRIGFVLPRHRLPLLKHTSPFVLFFLLKNVMHSITMANGVHMQPLSRGCIHENTCESLTTWMHALFSVCGAASHSN